MKFLRIASRAALAAGVLQSTGCVSPSPPPAIVTIPPDCRQLIVVTTPDWPATTGTLQLMDRDESSGWQARSGQWPVVVGRSGLRWGTGLHVNRPHSPRKHEGDGSSPAGLFELGTAFGREKPAGVNYPWLEITPDHAGVDDSNSVYYNTIVSRRAVTPDWTSAEDMMPPGGVYDKALVVQHNAERRPGAGSCIFFHIWNARRTPTAGCTAMSEKNMDRMLRWLEAAKHPLILQLPAKLE